MIKRIAHLIGAAVVFGVVFFGFLLSWAMPFIIWWQFGLEAAVLALVGMAAVTAAGKSRRGVKNE